MKMTVNDRTIEISSSPLTTQIRIIVSTSGSHLRPTAATFYVDPPEALVLANALIDAAERKNV